MAHLSLETPARRHPQLLQIVDDLLDEGLVDDAYEDLRRKYIPPTGFVWLDRADILRHRAGDPAPVEELAR